MRHQPTGLARINDSSRKIIFQHQCICWYPSLNLVQEEPSWRTINDHTTWETGFLLVTCGLTKRPNTYWHILRVVHILSSQPYIISINPILQPGETRQRSLSSLFKTIQVTKWQRRDLNPVRILLWKLMLYCPSLSKFQWPCFILGKGKN